MQCYVNRTSILQSCFRKTTRPVSRLYPPRWPQSFCDDVRILFCQSDPSIPLLDLLFHEELLISMFLLLLVPGFLFVIPCLAPFLIIVEALARDEGIVVHPELPVLVLRAD